MVYATLAYISLCQCRPAGVVSTNSAASVARVYDQYNRFVSLESGIFSLGLPQTYVQLNDPKAQDTEIEVRQRLRSGRAGSCWPFAVPHT